MPNETMNEISAHEQVTEEITLGSGHLTDQIPREETARVRKEGVQNLANKGLDIFSIIESVERTKKDSDEGLAFECVKAIKNKTTKILSENIAPEEVVTFYNSGLVIGPNKVQRLEDRYGYLGKVRKDLILMDEYLLEEKKQASQEGNSLSPDQIELFRKDIIYVFNNYEKTVNEWHEENTPKGSKRRLRNPSNENLLRWYVEYSGHDLEGKEGRDLNNLINRTLSYVSNTDKRIFDSYINKEQEPVYPSVSLPNQLILNKKGTVIGAVKTFNYDDAGVNLWLDTLNEASEVREKITNFDDPENAENLATAGFYDMQGAEVNILDKESRTPSTDRVGVNTVGISNFINIANQEDFGARTPLDVVDSVTGEVFNISDDHTIILRFPSDVGPELLRKTGETIENLTKNKRIIIQTIPYTTNDIGQAAYAAFWHFGMNNKENSEKDRFVAEHKSITEIMMAREMWYGAESK